MTRGKPPAALPEIIAAFQRQGAVALRAEGPVDLWVGYRKRWAAIKIKTKAKPSPQLKALVALAEKSELPFYEIESGRAVCPILDDLVRKWPIDL